MTVPQLKLHDGTTIPQLGLGVFQVPPEDTARVVTDALEVGYRHIDTAQMYRNEEGVGEALAAAALPRDEVYVTTKLNNGFHRPDDARRELAVSLERLRLDRVDLFLIHWPLPTRYDGDFASTWQTLLDLRDEGLTTSVGVSNFQPAHLARIIEATGEAPVVNQVECHPWFGNEEVRTADRDHGILTEAWAPIARGRVNDEPVITTIAGRLDRTPAQVTLRWHVQRGDIVFPKTVNPQRMRENFALFDFELTDDDMAAISGLDQGNAGRTGPDPDTFDWIP